MKAFFSRMKHTNKPKVVTDGETPKLHCPAHPDSTITHFCLAQDCTTPSLCSQCLSRHPRQHKAAFVSSHDFFNSQLICDLRKNNKSHYYPLMDQIRNNRPKMMRVMNTMKAERSLSVMKIEKEVDEWVSHLLSCHATVQRCLREYDLFKRLALTQASLSYAQASRFTTTFKTLQHNLNAVEAESKAVLEKIADDAKTLASRLGAAYEQDVQRTLSCKPMDFFTLKTALPWDLEQTITAITFASRYGVVVYCCVDPSNNFTLRVADVTSQKIISTMSYKLERMTRMFWIEQRSCLILCLASGKMLVVSLQKGGNLKVVGRLVGHTAEVHNVKYIENEDLLISTAAINYSGAQDVAIIWNMKTFKKYRAIYKVEKYVNNYVQGSVIYIPSAKLIGFQIRYTHIGFAITTQDAMLFYHVTNGKFAFKVLISSSDLVDFPDKIVDSIYLPKRNLLVVSKGRREIKMFKFDEKQLKLNYYKTIDTRENVVESVITNDDESQLLFVSQNSLIEMYSFKDDTKGRCPVNYVSQYYNNKKLIVMDTLNKVLLTDNASKNVVVLRFGV